MTLIPVYGMSECVGISCASWRDPQALRREGVGPFYAMNTARVVDDRGEEVPPGQEGEIWVKGPSRMVGYLGEDSGLDDQGFVHTGDLGLVDSRGRLYLTGRKKDIIIRNGVNLSPRPIEAALLSVRGVREAAVVALPHPSQGEAPWAAVVAEGGLTEAAILSALAPRLPKNHLPQRVVLMDALPRTAAGKVDKPRLKEALEKWREA